MLMVMMMMTMVVIRTRSQQKNVHGDDDGHDTDNKGYNNKS